MHRLKFAGFFPYLADGGGFKTWFLFLLLPSVWGFMIQFDDYFFQIRGSSINDPKHQKTGPNSSVICRACILDAPKFSKQFRHICLVLLSWTNQPLCCYLENVKKYWGLNCWFFRIGKSQGDAGLYAWFFIDKVSANLWPYRNGLERGPP